MTTILNGTDDSSDIDKLKGILSDLNSISPIGPAWIRAGEDRDELVGSRDGLIEGAKSCIEAIINGKSSLTHIGSPIVSLSKQKFPPKVSESDENTSTIVPIICVVIVLLVVLALAIYGAYSLVQ